MSTNCLWTPAWAGRVIPSSARGGLTRSSPSSRPTVGRFLRRQRAFPATATARRRRSASWSAPMRIWCASTTRSPSWSSRWSLCGSRARGPRNFWSSGMSCGGWRYPSGWIPWSASGAAASNWRRTIRRPSAARRRSRPPRRRPTPLPSGFPRRCEARTWRPTGCGLPSRGVRPRPMNWNPPLPF